MESKTCLVRFDNTGQLRSAALDIGARTYGSVKSILDNNLDPASRAKARHGRNADA
jgi:hypothetical protein